jgi:hypothetical protein
VCVCVTYREDCKNDVNVLVKKVRMALENFMTHFSSTEDTTSYNIRITL